ncbi:FIVAR domain-containing protein [Lachnoclostridium sp. An181]|uniref:FIVAR domain-containing protein n=1 Tax=Lachnoclostridium sp. An181 TaxID=1965575 RepID=UPI000B38F3E8|nr:FIVAR domain-containing protein [Lachnoclostridium sp. An181]OUP48617.1 hypothetical protein B5F18_11485 [Lachnoclostridium sp. An181]
MRELVEVRQYLSFKQGDKEDLEKVIALTAEMEGKLDSYVEEGKKEFTDALAAARIVYDDGDAMQEEVDQSWMALLEAMVNLRLKADKRALETLVNDAQGIALTDYTDESAEVFKTALAKAQSVLVDAVLSEDDQAVVDDAAKQLSSAKEGLKVKQASAGDVTVDDKADKSGNSAADDSKSSTQAKTTAKSVKTGDMDAYGTLILLMAAGAMISLYASVKRRAEQ